MNWQELSVFLFVFLAVTLIGFVAARWRPGDLNRLQEWGLGGKRFGSLISWFLIGGDVYTAYSFLAVPALVFAEGATGFFAVPYLIIVYPIVFIVMPRFWTVARHRGYVTPADFVRERFDSKALSLATAITGILATLPYIALQIYGIELCLAEMGVPVELALFIAFATLAAYTYISGLRGSALIAIVKDTIIWIVVLVALFSLTMRLGGMAHIFAALPQKKVLLSSQQYSTYVSLMVGSALALFLYPHAFTAVLSTNSRKVVKRTTAFLLFYTVLVGLIALLGIVAVAANIHASPIYKTNIALPALLTAFFPPQFTGFAFAAISISALVPAGVMSIAAANLFTRNIYREYINPDCTEREESNVAKTASLVVKVGALAFILFIPTTFAINLQLLSNIWIVQTLPAVFLGLYTRWFHRRALLVGWFFGMLVGTWSVVAQNFQSSISTISIFGTTISLYAAVTGLVVNLIIAVALTFVLQGLNVPTGEDSTIAEDYEAQPVIAAMQQAAVQQGQLSSQATPLPTPLIQPIASGPLFQPITTPPPPRPIAPSQPSFQPITTPPPPTPFAPPPTTPRTLLPTRSASGSSGGNRTIPRRPKR